MMSSSSLQPPCVPLCVLLCVLPCHCSAVCPEDVDPGDDTGCRDDDEDEDDDLLRPDDDVGESSCSDQCSVEPH